MRRSKPSFTFSAVVDDASASPFNELQSRLNDIQQGGMTALTMKTVLFHKVLDMHNVPSDHTLRQESAPSCFEASEIIKKLNALGFYKNKNPQLH